MGEELLRINTKGILARPTQQECLLNAGHSDKMAAEGGDFAQKCYSASHYYDKIPGIISEDKMFALTHGVGGASQRMVVWSSNGVRMTEAGDILKGKPA